MSLGSQKDRSCRQAAASILGRGVKGAKGGAVSKNQPFKKGCAVSTEMVCGWYTLSSWWEYGTT